MAWINAFPLIRILLVAHFLAGILLIRSPKTLTEQSVVFLLGEAIGLPPPKSTFHLNPLATSILGVMFIFSGITDLIAVSAVEELSRGYWEAQAPVRMAFFFSLTGYTYLYRPGRENMYSTTTDPLKNSLVFTWAFTELVTWFWIYSRLREERHGAQQRIESRKRMQAQLNGDVDDFGR